MAFTPQHPQHGSDLVQVSRFETMLRRVLNIKAAGLVRAVDPNISLSIDPLQGLAFEHRHHQGIRSWRMTAIRVASVANRGKYSIWNPVGSKTLLVVESVAIGQSGAPVDTQIVIINVDPGASNYVATSRDYRLEVGTPGAPVGGVAVLQSGDAAAAFVGWPVSLGGTSFAGVSYGVPIVLPPGFGIAGNSGVNAINNFQADWYERTAEGAELGR